jgi:lipooligosaccharide transport system permease protein
MAATTVFRVVEREARVYRKMLRAVSFSTFVQPLLYLGAIGFGLGNLVDEHSGTVEGLSYLDFVAPGLLVASTMQLAVANTMWPVLGGVKWFRNFYGIVATAIQPAELYFGIVIWEAIRAAVAASAFLLIAALLGGIPSAWGVLAIPVASLVAAAFAGPMAAFSIRQESDLAFPMFMRLGVLPLFLFSGTFFPVSQLPNSIEWLAVFSPLWHGVELARMATTGTFDGPAIVVHVAVLAACVAVGARVGMSGFRKRLNP